MSHHPCDLAIEPEGRQEPRLRPGSAGSLSTPRTVTAIMERPDWDTDERRQRNTALGRLHNAWSRKYADSVPVPDVDGEDVSVHHLDMASPVDAEAEFQAAARKIMGL